MNKKKESSSSKKRILLFFISLCFLSRVEPTFEFEKNKKKKKDNTPIMIALSFIGVSSSIAIGVGFKVMSYDNRETEREDTLGPKRTIPRHIWISVNKVLENELKNKNSTCKSFSTSCLNIINNIKPAPQANNLIKSCFSISSETKSFNENDFVNIVPKDLFDVLNKTIKNSDFDNVDIDSLDRLLFNYGDILVCIDSIKNGKDFIPNIYNNVKIYDVTKVFVFFRHCVEKRKFLIQTFVDREDDVREFKDYINTIRKNPILYNFNPND